MGLFTTKKATSTAAETDEHGSDVTSRFTAAGGANSSKPTYQEATGAPVEENSPLGYSVGAVTVVFLNLSKMIGTGVFSTRRFFFHFPVLNLQSTSLCAGAEDKKASTILSGSGSVGLTLVYWTIGYLMAASSQSVYLEFASYFPSRSGSEVVYLEQSYPRPKYFFPTVFAMQTVVFSFSSSNAVVLAQYLFSLAGTESESDWGLKGIAVASYTVAVLVLAFDTKWSLRLANAIGFIKLITLIFIGITGLVVLGGHTSVEDPLRNFRNAFEGSSSASVYGATNAFVKVMFSYAGFENAFNVVNEVKNPIKTLRWSAPLSLVLTATLYILANIAYFSAASKDEILNSDVVAASIFFKKVFGTSSASRALNFLICLCAFGNLLAVLIGQSRMLRECGRQGVLPWTKFWTSTRPFGTPLGPYFLKWALTVIMIIAPPAGDAFNFVVDLSMYPMSIFSFLLAIGLLLTRHRRKQLKYLEQSESYSYYRAWNVAVFFSIVSNLYMLVAPWYPPSTGATGGDVSFWYATYCVVGIAMISIVACGFYYYFWIKILPRIGGFEYRQTVVQVDEDGGATANKLVRIKRGEELDRWDSEHGTAGRVI